MIFSFNCQYLLVMPKTLLLTLLSAAFLLACSDRVKDTHPLQLVSKRQAIFKKMTKTLEPMGLVARDRQDYVKADFVASALLLQELSTQPWTFFAADGNYPPTRAKPEVWSQAAEFKQAQDNYLTTVEQLVKVSGSGDKASISTAVDSVQRSCKTCHDRFRKEQQ